MTASALTGAVLVVISAGLDIAQVHPLHPMAYGAVVGAAVHAAGSIVDGRPTRAHPSPPRSASRWVSRWVSRRRVAIALILGGVVAADYLVVADGRGIGFWLTEAVPCTAIVVGMVLVGKQRK